MKGRSTIVIVGRPNVGKSTLFNRLTRTRRALVHDLPGVTRDRIVGDAEPPWGGEVTVVDTGGLMLEDEDAFVPLIRDQASTAIKDCDAVVFVVDGNAGPIPEDLELAGFLRNLGPPVVVAVNKADRRDVDLQAFEFHRLGLGEPVLISAEHGTGIYGLWEALEPHVRIDEAEEPDPAAESGEDEIRVTIVGRPNVGKSSLLNRLIGEPRVLVSEVPGTTRDAIDVVLEHGGLRFRFVDTAGIRRKGRTERGPEVLSVVMARRSLEQAHIALVLVDAVEGVTNQDAHVAGYAWDAGRALVIVVNKWDLIENRAVRRAELEDQLYTHFRFVRHAPWLSLSALTGKGVTKLFPAIAELHRAYNTRVTTSDLNHILRNAWQSRPPSVPGRRAAKFYYASQIHQAPPSFVLFTNLQQQLHFSYLRYLENVLRQTLSLAGVPIRVMIRGRKS